MCDPASHLRSSTMNILSHLRISARLALGFAVVLLLSVCATGVALYNARANAEATKLMMAKPLAKERIVADWYVLIYSAVVRTQVIARSTDDSLSFFFFQADDGIRDHCMTGVQTCALPILSTARGAAPGATKAVDIPVVWRG